MSRFSRLEHLQHFHNPQYISQCKQRSVFLQFLQILIGCKHSIILYFKWASNIKYEYHTILKPESEKTWKPESHLVLTSHTDSQPWSECLQAVCPSPNPPLHLWSGGIGFSLVRWAFPNTSQIPGARRVCLEQRTLKSIGCQWSGDRNTQKRPPKATALMGTDVEENTNTTSLEICSYLSISSIYRSSTIIIQFKFRWEKAVFRMSFTISAKYTVCSCRFMHGAVLRCTIFLHTLSWHKKNLGICDSNGNLSLLQGKNILNSLMLALPPLSPSFMLYLCLPLSLALTLSFFFPSPKFLISLTFSVPFGVF